MDLPVFIAKKMVTALFYPLGTSLFLVWAGIVVWFAKPRSRTGLLLASAGALWLTAMSCPITGQILLRSLEKHASAYASAEELRLTNVRYIVVLGGDLRTGDLTPTDRIACSSLVRVMEGIRLWRGVPGTRLVLSGGAYSRNVITSAEGMAAVAVEQGVPSSAILLESQSLDTGDEARLLKPILGSEPFALVTSASHMRRSEMNFRRHGMNPLPAPADFLVRALAPRLQDFVPHARGLEISQKALHEYLGIWAFQMRRLISS